MNIKVPCVVLIKNTGMPDCPFEPGIPYWAVLAPKGYDEITEANRVDDATLKLFMEGNFQNTNKSQRWQKFGPIIDAQDASEEAPVQTLPNGAKITTDDMRAAIDLYFQKGGIQLNNARRGYNNLAEYYTLYIFDKKWRLLGTVSEDNTDNMVGYDMDNIYTPGIKGPTRTTISEKKTQIAFSDVAQHNEYLAAIQLNFDLGKITGVRDIKLKDVSADYTLTDGQVAIQVLTDGGSINLVEKLGAAMATATNYTLKNTETNPSTAISKTAALSSDGKAVIISASLADVNYIDGELIRYDWNMAQGGTNGAKWFESDADNPLIVAATNP